jgi:hypothetical protein
LPKAVCFSAQSNILERRNGFGDAAINERQVLRDEMFLYRGSANVGRADNVMQPYSLFEGLMNECPGFARGWLHL